MGYNIRKCKKVLKGRVGLVMIIFLALASLMACGIEEEAVVKLEDLKEETGVGKQIESNGSKAAEDEKGMSGDTSGAGSAQSEGAVSEEVQYYDSALKETEERMTAVSTLPADGEGWGLSFGEEGSQPVGNATSEELAQFDAYFMGAADEKVIYLTFDCGYENGNTEPILDALKKHNAPATFFVVGHFLEEAPELAERMVEDGHTVGSHTYNHPDITTFSGEQTFQEEMDAVRAKFWEVTGTELSMYYRPPEGICSAENLRAAQKLGYSTFFWSLAYVDWDTENQPNHKEAVEKLTKRIHPGAVVLLHNTSQTNGEILDELLTEWEKAGYTVRPLAELLKQEARGAVKG